MIDLNTVANLNPVEFTAKGKKVYEGIKERLEENHKDKFVAIEPDSGSYFLGSEPMKAINKGKKKYPNKIFYLVRIGRPAVITMSSRYQPLNYESIF